MNDLEIADTCIRLVSWTIKSSKAFNHPRGRLSREDDQTVVENNHSVAGNEDILCCSWDARFPIKFIIFRLAECRCSNSFVLSPQWNRKTIKSILDNNLKIQFHSPPCLRLQSLIKIFTSTEKHVFVWFTMQSVDINIAVEKWLGELLIISKTGEACGGLCPENVAVKPTRICFSRVLCKGSWNLRNNYQTTSHIAPDDHPWRQA